MPELLIWKVLPRGILMSSRMKRSTVTLPMRPAVIAGFPPTWPTIAPASWMSEFFSSPLALGNSTLSG